MTSITGVITRFTHRNEENGYTVAHLAPIDGSTKIKVVGVFPVLEVGETITVSGDWKVHPKHGRQFAVEKYRAETPVTIKGLKSYLASGLFNGIGPKMAERLVDKFGTKVLDIIKNNPERLSEVEGIGQSKIDSILQGMNSAEDHESMIFLQGLGLTPGYAGRVIRHYGEETINVIRANPYLLSDDVYGIGFKTADKLALANGLEVNHPERMIAGIKYILQQMADEGHCFVAVAQLQERAAELLEVDIAPLVPAIQTLRMKKEIIIEQLNNHEEVIYLAPFFVAERGVAGSIVGLAQWQSTILTDFQAMIAAYEVKQGFELAPKQREAVKMAINNGFTVITGGPGTGKTTIVKCIINLFEQFGKHVSLAAPTGRAAQRLSDTSGKEAKTIHRLLEYAYDESEGMKFARDSNKPLTTDVLIVDEVSMVDIILMYHLLQAIPPGCQVILVGDVDQLPSVGAGNVLRDIIDAGAVPVARLNTIFRQAEKSLIVVNAHKINNGEFPYLKDKDRDFFFLPRTEPEAIVKTVIGLCKTRLPQFGGYHPIEDIQVLTPMRRTITGVDNLNELLQQALNPLKEGRGSLQRGNQSWREGDKVMQIRNNYRKNVYNGDVGRLIEIDRDAQVVRVKYRQGQISRIVDYNFDEIKELVLAYAISIHKSQGSEYPVVIMPVTTQHYLMLQRNLFYTGITRAKQLVVMVGTKKALAISVKNNKVVERNTALRERIINCLGGSL